MLGLGQNNAGFAGLKEGEFMHSISKTALLAASIAMAACGGGGDSNTVQGPVAPAPAPAPSVDVDRYVGSWSRCFNLLPNLPSYVRVTYQLFKVSPSELQVQYTRELTGGQTCGVGTQLSIDSQNAVISMIGGKSTVLGVVWDKVELRVGNTVRKELMSPDVNTLYLSWDVDSLSYIDAPSFVSRDVAGYPSDFIVQETNTLTRQ